MDNTRVLHIDIPELRKIAFDELHESPEVYKQELNVLKSLIKNDSNLIVPEDDAFLLRFLRARKHDGRKAFLTLQRYYLMKMKCPELFICPLPSESLNVFNLQAQMVLEKRDAEFRRVYIIKIENFRTNEVSMDEAFRLNLLALEQVVREPETQIAGVVVLLDMNGLSMNHTKFFSPYYAKRMVELVQETFPLRFKGFHIVNEPFYFDAVMVVLKPFLKDKIRKRIFLHGSDMNTLHAFLDPAILPSEYGGTNGPFNNKQWKRSLLDDEQYYKDQNKYGYTVDEGVEVDL